MRIRIVRDVAERLKTGEAMDIPAEAAGQLIGAGFAEELPLVDVGGVGFDAGSEILTGDGEAESSTPTPPPAPPTKPAPKPGPRPGPKPRPSPRPGDE